MLNVLVALACGSFTLVAAHLLLQGAPRTTLRGENRIVTALALLLCQIFVPLLFLVERGSGTAILQEGLSASNLIVVAFTLLLAGLAAFKTLVGGYRVGIVLERAYLPFVLMLAVDLASTAWSIVPSVTAFRAVETIALFVTCVMLFDREAVEKALVLTLALIVAVTLVTAIDVIAGNLARGIVFSAAKNNMSPLVCVVLAMACLTYRRRIRHALPLILLAVVGFVVGGSAATVASLPAVGIGWLMASDRRGVRAAGWVLLALYAAGFGVALFGLGQFPGLVSLASALLQKPEEELLKATGRLEFWPLFLEAGLRHPFGSGYVAGERFIQLVLGDAVVGEILGTSEVNISQSHNMFLSAWIGTGWIGLTLALVVIVQLMRQAYAADLPTRRFVLGATLLIVFNGTTTPGVFSVFTIHVVVLAGLLALVRGREVDEALAAGVAAEPRSAPRLRAALPAPG